MGHLMESGVGFGYSTTQRGNGKYCFKGRIVDTLRQSNVAMRIPYEWTFQWKIHEKSSVNLACLITKGQELET